MENSVADITASVLLKDRFKHDETYKGYVRHNSDGSLVSSGGAISLKYKNQGFTYIDIYSTNPAPNDSVPDGTTAPFNVVSFYSEGQWLGGQGYMQESSVPAIYGSGKHYKVQIPEGCELILVTLGYPIDNTDTVEIYKDDHSKYLTTIDNLTDVRFLLPPYFTAAYLRNKKNTIEARINANAANSDIFIFMTDEHWERGNGHSFSAVKWLDENCNIPRLFSGGDTGHEGINMDFIKIRKKAFKGKIYQTIGNHEYLSYTFDTDGNTTEDEVFYGLEMNQGDECIYGNNKRHYYYVDNSIKKIRYVILNAFAQGNGSVNSATIGFEQEQLDWFRNTALNVDSGWSIIIFTHRLYEGSPSNSANTYIPTTCQPVADIIESYAGNGKIIAVFQGHTHYDAIKYLKDGTIPVIITTSDHNGSYRWSDSEGKYIRDYDVERESGTINEHAFDVVIIDKVLKRISCVRIGCPAKDGDELKEERLANWV